MKLKKIAQGYAIIIGAISFYNAHKKEIDRFTTRVGNYIKSCLNEPKMSDNDDVAEEHDA